MAIAPFANARGSSGTGTLNFNIECPTDNPILVVQISRLLADISSFQYNSQNCTHVVDAGSGGEKHSTWIKTAPSTGTNAISISWTGGGTLYAQAESYSGAAQTSQPNAYNSGQGGTPTFSLAVTTTVDGCWCVIGAKDQGYGITAGSGTTLRGTYNVLALGDSNGAKTPAGSVTLNLNSDSPVLTGTMIAIAPAVAAATSKNLLLLGVG